MKLIPDTSVLVGMIVKSATDFEHGPCALGVAINALRKMNTEELNEFCELMSDIYSKSDRSTQIHMLSFILTQTLKCQ